ncbi:hypothetical protein L1887_53912 [Cichorium endivia]|nr:hypothetical protein L1887_53912 [Cichorium endivia]
MNRMSSVQIGSAHKPLCTAVQHCSSTAITHTNRRVPSKVFFSSPFLMSCWKLKNVNRKSCNFGFADPAGQAVSYGRIVTVVIDLSKELVQTVGLLKLIYPIIEEGRMNLIIKNGLNLRPAADLIAIRQPAIPTFVVFRESDCVSAIESLPDVLDESGYKNCLFLVHESQIKAVKELFDQLWPKICSNYVLGFRNETNQGTFITKRRPVGFVLLVIDDDEDLLLVFNLIVSCILSENFVYISFKEGLPNCMRIVEFLESFAGYDVICRVDRAGDLQDERLKNFIYYENKHLGSMIKCSEQKLSNSFHHLDGLLFSLVFSVYWLVFCSFSWLLIRRLSLASRSLIRLLSLPVKRSSRMLSFLARNEALSGLVRLEFDDFSKFRLTDLAEVSEMVVRFGFELEFDREFSELSDR